MGAFLTEGSIGGTSGSTIVDGEREGTTRDDNHVLLSGSRVEGTSAPHLIVFVQIPVS